MGFIRGSLIFSAAFLLVLAVSIFVLFAGMRSLLYPDIYLETFEKNNLYSEVENWVGDKIGSGANFLVISDSQETTERLLTNFLLYVRGKSSSPNLTIEINRTEFRNFFEEQIKNTTFCKFDEDPFENDEINCRPRNRNSSEFLEDVVSVKNVTFFDENTIDLAYVYSENGDFSSVKQSVYYFNLAFYSLIFISLLLIGLIFLLKFTKYTGAMKIVGLCFVLAGLLIAAPIFFGSYFFNNYLENFFGGRIPIPFLSESAEYLFFSVLWKIYFYSGTVIFVGLVLIVSSFFLKVKLIAENIFVRKSKKKSVQKSFEKS